MSGGGVDPSAANGAVTGRYPVGRVVGADVGAGNKAVVAPRLQPRTEGAVLSNHAWRRVVERLAPTEQQEFFARMKHIEARAPLCGHDFGVRVMRTGKQHGDTWGKESNGDDVWAVIRDGAIKTVMFRRSNQPPDAWALRVDKVVLL